MSVCVCISKTLGGPDDFAPCQVARLTYILCGFWSDKQSDDLTLCQSLSTNIIYDAAAAAANHSHKHALTLHTQTHTHVPLQNEVLIYVFIVQAYMTHGTCVVLHTLNSYKVQSAVVTTVSALNGQRSSFYYSRNWIELQNNTWAAIDRSFGRICDGASIILFIGET